MLSGKVLVHCFLFLCLKSNSSSDSKKDNYQQGCFDIELSKTYKIRILYWIFYSNTKAMVETRLFFKITAQRQLVNLKVSLILWLLRKEVLQWFK